MSGRLVNKVALITGAGRGIGQAIAEKMAVEGAAVVIAEIDRKSGQQTAADLSAKGLRALFVHTDITQENSVQNAAAQAVEQFGGLDILVNNAGVNFYFDATQMSGEDWDRAMAVDLKGAWLCCKYAIPAMRQRGGGAVVNIASVHATMTTYGMFPYAAAKSGLIGMTRSLALDWAAENIRVVAVSPGWVRTYLVDEWLSKQADPQTAEAQVLKTLPLGRMATPQDVANLVAFVASDEAAYLTGTEIIIDGGVTAKFAT
jgi:NAD(P)-dependent dehydrogenase (short-subunit alcohol dehydrogenase family)